MLDIKWRIMGMNRTAVDEHVKQKQLAQEAELETLTKKIQTSQREKELLEQELEILTDQHNSFTSKTQLEFALKKVASVTAYIDQSAEEDVLAIQKSNQQMLLLFEPARWFWGEQLEDIAESQRGEDSPNFSEENELTVNMEEENKESNNSEDDSYFEVETFHGENNNDLNVNNNENGANYFSEGQTGFWESCSSWEEPSEHCMLPAVTQDRETNVTSSQASVRREINAVRHKYVLGKIVGENIIDDTGQVIICKNEKITDKVFDLAEKKGKLADLIIHMVLAEQEE